MYDCQWPELFIVLYCIWCIRQRLCSISYAYFTREMPRYDEAVTYVVLTTDLLFLRNLWIRHRHRTGSSAGPKIGCSRWGLWRWVFSANRSKRGLYILPIKNKISSYGQHLVQWTETYASFPISCIMCMKTWHHSQNRKYNSTQLNFIVTYLQLNIWMAK